MLLNVLKIVFYLGFISYPPSVYSQDLETLFYKETSKFYSSVTQGKYYSRLSLNFREELANIHEDMEKVNVSVTNVFLAGSGDKNRHGAFAIRDQVIFNIHTLSQVLQGKYKRLFLYHEFLRAKGIDDENYQMTVTLELITNAQKHGLSEKWCSLLVGYMNEVGLKKRDYIYENGTGTSVGGGGDILALSIKLAVIRAMIIQNFSMKKVAEVLQTSFESSLIISAENTVSSRIKVTQNRIIIPAIFLLYMNGDKLEIINNIIELFKN